MHSHISEYFLIENLTHLRVRLHSDDRKVLWSIGQLGGEFTRAGCKVDYAGVLMIPQLELFQDEVNHGVGIRRPMVVVVSAVPKTRFGTSIDECGR